VANASDPIAAYRRHGPALVRKARRILQSEDDARDIVQALFVDLMEKSGSRLDLPYLYRAVTNRCLNLLRDEGNRRRLLAEQAPALRGPVRTLAGDRVVDVDLLARLSDRLDARSLEIIVCLYVDDMTQEETATLLGISRRAVVKRVGKIRAALEAIAGGEEAAS
jgi:RNA polymerase sigma-70 factor (ECF subfamily)